MTSNVCYDIHPPPPRHFRETAVADRVARFGGYLFVQTDAGWRVVGAVAPSSDEDEEEE